MEDVEPRGELRKGERRLAKAFTIACGADQNAIAPILATVIVGIEEVDPHGVIGAKRGAQNRDRVPTDET